MSNDCKLKVNEEKNISPQDNCVRTRHGVRDRLRNSLIAGRNSITDSEGSFLNWLVHNGVEVSFEKCQVYFEGICFIWVLTRRT